MPFHKNKNKSEGRNLNTALGISDEKSDEILEFVHKLVHKVNNNEQNLKHLYGKYNDMELMCATYAYGRMVEGHTDNNMPEEIMSFLKGFGEFLDGKTK